MLPLDKIGLISCPTYLPASYAFLRHHCLYSIFQLISTPANDTIHDLILSGSLASPLLLITAFLPYVLVVSLMAFTEILAHIVVKTLRANL